MNNANGIIMSFSEPVLRDPGGIEKIEPTVWKFVFGGVEFVRPSVTSEFFSELVQVNFGA